jgi:hypothetical protein
VFIPIQSKNRCSTTQEELRELKMQEFGNRRNGVDAAPLKKLQSNRGTLDLFCYVLGDIKAFRILEET